MKIYKKFFILLFLFILYFTLCAFHYSNAVTKNISDTVFRLHVIANSDSIDDQKLKYKVRDDILNYMNTITNNVSSKEEIIPIIYTHLDDFKEIAQNVIYQNGYNYNVCIEMGNFDFPKKTYGDISFPAGFYDALRVKIGDASGQNWWCVMFPPLCFIDISSGVVPDDSREMLKSELTEEEYNIISGNHKELNVKFKIVEVLQNLKNSGIFM